MQDDWTPKRFIKYISAIVAILIAMIVIGSVSYRHYSVWAKKKQGEARLAEAEHSRKILWEEAKAKRLAATELAAAEVERAKGVAEANKIIGDSLRNNESYLRYLWIQGLHNDKTETIYVPTEANLPILEAGRKLK